MKGQPWWESHFERISDLLVRIVFQEVLRGSLEDMGKLRGVQF
jgi:hypothetical protein